MGGVIGQRYLGVRVSQALNLSQCLCWLAIPDPLTQMLKVELPQLKWLKQYFFFKAIISIHNPNLRKGLVSMRANAMVILTHI